MARFQNPTTTNFFLLTARVVITFILLLTLFILAFTISYVSSRWRKIPARGVNILPEAQIKLPKSSPYVKGLSSDISISGGCVIGGCSRELCVDISESDKVFSTCVFKPEYACYEKAICERQSNGKCGWRKTSELESCLEQYKTGE